MFFVFLAPSNILRNNSPPYQNKQIFFYVLYLKSFEHNELTFTDLRAILLLFLRLISEKLNLVFLLFISFF